jgi:hypothetical protein
MILKAGQLAAHKDETTFKKRWVIYWGPNHIGHITGTQDITGNYHYMWSHNHNDIPACELQSLASLFKQIEQFESK